MVANILQAMTYGAGLTIDRAKLLHSGYVRQNPMSLLQLGPGRDNPYPIYEQLRAAGTLTATDVDNWVSTSHRVCSLVLRDRRFGVRPPDSVRTAPDAEQFDVSMLSANPPDHTRLRRLVQPAFSPRAMRGYRKLIEQTVDELLAKAAAKGSFDFVADVAAPLPVAVITAMLGIPEADVDKFARYGATIAGVLDGIRSLPHAWQLMNAHTQLVQMFEKLIELRRTEPGDDVISRIVAAEADFVDAKELMGLCELLLIGGFETTINLLGNGVMAFLDHPDQWALLCADPAGLAESAVDEVLRFDTPVQRTGRVALESIELEGETVEPGQFVVTLLGAANRDPEVYSDPEVFDIERERAVENLAFSGGIHYCLGAPLARLEAAVTFRALAEQMPGLRLNGIMRRRNAAVIRGPKTLPVAAAFQ